MRKEYSDADKAFSLGQKIIDVLEDDSKQNTDLNNIQLPYVLKNQVLMSPGQWNDNFFTFQEIRTAFDSTDWDDSVNRALFLDHEDDSSATWIGEIKNQQQVGEDLVGDLFIVDRDTAVKLAYGAKFGISPKLTGDEKPDKTVTNFTYNNFSVVFNPACKTTFLNKQKNSHGLITGVTLILRNKNSEANNMDEKELANFDMSAMVSMLLKQGYDEEQANRIANAAQSTARSLGSAAGADPKKNAEENSDEKKPEAKPAEAEKKPVENEAKKEMDQIQNDIDKLKLEQKKQEYETMKQKVTTPKELSGRKTTPSSNAATKSLKEMTTKELKETIQKSPESEKLSCYLGLMKRQVGRGI